MTRTAHKAHATPSFPVYCLGWADDQTLLLGGGGGASRSGIENKLKICKVAKDGRKVKYTTELKLSSDEDAPMTMAVDRQAKILVTGVNASSPSVQNGINDHCRVYSYGDDKIQLVRSTGTIRAAWSDDYPFQKITVISPDTSLVAIGTTENRVTIFRHPFLDDAVYAISLDSELVDLAWEGANGEWFAITTTSSLLLYSVNTSGEKIKLDLKQTIYPPSLDISPVSFRAARFSTSAATVSTPSLHAVLNVTTIPKKGAPRKAFVVTFGMVAGPSKAPMTAEEIRSTSKGKDKEVPSDGEELGRWDVLARREVAGKPVTVFDVSADGKLLAYGCADLSIGILDGKTLAPLLKILKAHSFPPTALKFNPSASLLVSASPDHTIRAIVVPASFDGLSPSMIALVVALLVIVIAVLMRR